MHALSDSPDTQLILLRGQDTPVSSRHLCLFQLSVSAPVVFGVNSCLWLGRLSVSVPVVLATAVKDVLLCLHLFYGTRDFCNSSCALFYGWFFLILKACKQHKSSVTSVLFAASCFASDFRSGFAYIPVNMRGEAHRNTFANCVSPQLFFPTSVQPPPQDKETFTPDLKAYIWNLASMIGNAILQELENGKKPGGKLLHHKSSLEESSVPLAAIPMREFARI